MKKELENKINSIVEQNIMSLGKMGTETVSSKIHLSDEEIEIFKSIDTFDSENYFWEIEGNVLYLDYTEEV